MFFLSGGEFASGEPPGVSRETFVKTTMDSPLFCWIIHKFVRKEDSHVDNLAVKL